MSTESPRTAPVGFDVLNHWNAKAVAYWTMIFVMAAALVFVWVDRGADRPSYGFMVVACTYCLGPGLTVPVLRRVPPGWFRVPAGEGALHRLVGVGVFGWVLERSGYNRIVVKSMWRFSMNRAGLRSRALTAQGAISSHGACFAIHIALCALAGVRGYSRGALWILMTGVVVHGYPVLLQRSILLRLQPLLRKNDRTDEILEGYS